MVLSGGFPCRTPQTPKKNQKRKNEKTKNEKTKNENKPHDGMRPRHKCRSPIDIGFCFFVFWVFVEFCIENHQIL